MYYIQASTLQPLKTRIHHTNSCYSACSAVLVLQRSVPSILGDCIDATWVMQTTSGQQSQPLDLPYAYT